MKLVYFKLKPRDKEYSIGLLKDNRVLYLSEYNYLYRYSEAKVFKIKDINIINRHFEKFLEEIKNDILEQDKIQIIHTQKSRFVGGE
ncbi:MAG: hypothetical protein RR942_01430 [Romboutsia sp.]